MSGMYVASFTTARWLDARCYIRIFPAKWTHFSPEPQPPFFGALQWPTMREHDQSDSHDHVPAHMAAQT